MATINSIYYVSPGKQLIIDDSTNQFIVSGYRLTLDPNLNRDLNIVSAPDTTGDFGNKGNIAFDNHHIYYCINTDTWVRARLASWGDDLEYAPIQSPVPIPSNWWNFTSNALDTIGSYNFQNPTSTQISFSEENGFTNPSFDGCLLNYTSNLVDLPASNTDFSISFEVKRINNGFLMGSLAGRLGFHFEFTGPGNTYAGIHGKLTFALSRHSAGRSFNWIRATSDSTISTSAFTQVVVTNDSISKIIKLYINGTLERSTSYAGVQLGAYFNPPSYQGWGIGASPNGSYSANLVFAGGGFGRAYGAYVAGTPVNSTESYSSSNIRYMGFWKRKALSAQEVTYLYNNGNFRRYPFV